MSRLSLAGRSPCAGLLLALMGAAFLFVAADGAKAAAPSEAKRPAFAPLDIFGIDYVADVAISPDGQRIAYQVLTMDAQTDRRVSTIRLFDRKAGRDAALPDSTGASAPAWCPDGGAVLFLKDGEVRIWRAGSHALETVAIEGRVSEARWSPDGMGIAFVASVAEPPVALFEMPAGPPGAHWADPPITAFGAIKAYGQGEISPRATRVGVADLSSGASRIIADGTALKLGELAWMSGGEALLATGLAEAGASERLSPRALYRLRLDKAGTPEKIETGTKTASSPIVSSDGEIAFLGGERFDGIAHKQLWQLEGRGKARCLTCDLDRDVRAARWGPDGAAYIVYADSGRFDLARVAPDGARKVMATGLGPSDMGRPQPKAAQISVSDEGAVAFIQSGALKPGDVAVANAHGVEALTHLADRLGGSHAFGAIEEVRFPSRADGLEIQSWLFKPPHYQKGRRYPLILFMHGGPWGTFAGPYFGGEVQMYAAAGYLVLAVNYRGSGSFSQGFTDSNAKAFPGLDYEDLMTGVDRMIARGLADPDRLYVTGGSAGGMLTAWIVGHTDRFRAAAALKPASSLETLALAGDDPDIYSLFAKAPPWVEPEHYRKYSPITYVGNVKTPTLLMVGGADVRTPPAEAEMFYNALRLRDVPTALVRLPGAGHELSARPSQLMAGAMTVMAWFARYGGEPVPSAEDQ